MLRATSSSHKVIILKCLVTILMTSMAPKFAMAQALGAIMKQVAPIARAIKPNAPMTNVNGVNVYPLNKYNLDIPLAIQREGQYLSNRNHVYNSQYDGLVKVTTYNVGVLNSAPAIISKALTKKGRVGFHVNFHTALGFFTYVGTRAGQKFARFTLVPRNTSIEIPITVVVDDTAKFPTSKEISSHFTNSKIRVTEHCQTTVFGPISTNETLSMEQFVKKAKNLDVNCAYFLSGFTSSGAIANLRATGAR